MKDVAEGALSALGADIVLFYPLDRESQLLTTPISAGHIFDESHPLSLPNERTNIVQHVAAAMQPYYEADVHKDTLFIGARGVGAPTRSFAARQRVHSFAGIPLIARGTLHGILCVNYRTRHEFSPSKRQVIELYAQMTATVIANGQYTREQERRRLEYDLHDAVKSSLRGLILLSHAATNALDLNVQSARRHLHDVRRAAWGILADLDMILHDLALTSRDRSALHNYIRNDIGRMVGQNWDRVIVEIAPNLPALPTHTARAMLFILREAFMNAVEHASAQHIQVQVHYVNGHIHIVVADDGCGFDSSVKQDTIHRGLTSIYERVQTAGGSVELTTAEGHGTHLFIQLPGKEYADDQH